MINKYRGILIHSGTKSKSKYKGGFVSKNGRLNNSKEYNHDYYLKNKEKWNKQEDPDNPYGDYDHVRSEERFKEKQRRSKNINYSVRDRMTVDYYEKKVNKLFSKSTVLPGAHRTEYGDDTNTKNITSNYKVYKDVGLIEQGKRYVDKLLKDLFKPKKSNLQISYGEATLGPTIKTKHKIKK